jgi:alpha-beta hydrolase superfamily lysophospholipase
MKNLLILVAIFLFSCSNNKTVKKQINKNIVQQVQQEPKKKIQFKSKDGLLITADLYEIENPKDFILLCHQAGFSRGEYKDTAVKLNKLGYSCLAIDQRSGRSANAISNETAKRAKEKNLPTKYLDAKQDIEAAIDFAVKKNKNNNVIIVGSSYSASLVLLITTSNDKVKAVASFSPGEYLKGLNLSESIIKLNKPVFVTSSKAEIAQTESVISKIISKEITHFKPEVKGIHGSRALWSTTIGNESYWEAFTGFLSNLN